mmetsp:Transcript_59607/g.141831  ORF Transcript_59607/g.141831 Transcript_59607/m.141831 type:complete len:321 (-) Transcript_59607:131-1093(-)
MPLYEEKIINPLAVRFSQDRIWPDFQDGRHIEDSLQEIDSVEAKVAYYDVILRPPFPPMEIIRLKQERREDDGERMRDPKGRRIYGEESWFTFDNRRLYCLQRKALQLWPTAVAVVVKVLFDFPEVRCARHKFRTTSDGCSVKISLPDGSPGSRWCWQEVVETEMAPPEAGASGPEAVKRDSTKNRKEVLVDVPPFEVLNPGCRESTVAERFNLGGAASFSNNAGSSHGEVAGKQLLNILQGAGGPLEATGALSAPWTDDATWEEGDWSTWSTADWSSNQATWSEWSWEETSSVGSRSYSGKGQGSRRNRGGGRRPKGGQ